VIADAGQGDNIMAELMGAFAAIALTLATMGIYGLISYVVGQRSHEMGIRMSLGANPIQVFLLVIRGGLSLVGIGAALGGLMSLAVLKLLSSSFSGFHPNNIGTLIVAPVVVGAASFVACYIPARRAMRVDPMVALRYE
jgi:ABC-type antimicrobial peptide transport system permease subunit